LEAQIQGRITAIVLAGQRPGVDAFASQFGMDVKALVPLAGEAMLTHVVRTLNASPLIGDVIVLSQQPERLHSAISAGGGARIWQSNAGISSSLLELADSDAAGYPWLVTTADHPLLTVGMIDQFLGDAKGDLSVGMVSRTNMLATYPDNKRTWLKFADDGWSGANLFFLGNRKVHAALMLWSAAEKDRKKAWKMFWHFGPWLAFLSIARRITMQRAMERAGIALKLAVCLVAMTDPVAAIDVDKMSDHDTAENIIQNRR
jgi:CTP:molybdopterin cytidylyltransferase MocA